MSHTQQRPPYDSGLPLRPATGLKDAIGIGRFYRLPGSFKDEQLSVQWLTVSRQGKQVTWLQTV